MSTCAGIWFGTRGAEVQIHEGSQLLPCPKSLRSGQGHRQFWASMRVGFPAADFQRIVGSWMILGRGKHILLPKIWRWLYGLHRRSPLRANNLNRDRHLTCPFSGCTPRSFSFIFFTIRYPERPQCPPLPAFGLLEPRVTVEPTIFRYMLNGTKKGSAHATRRTIDDF